jgi:hypothetical protein
MVFVVAPVYCVWLRQYYYKPEFRRFDAQEFLRFFNRFNPSSHTVALGWSQHLKELSAKFLPGSKGLSAHKAHLTAICEPIVRKMWERRRLTTLPASAACYVDRQPVISVLYSIEVYLCYSLQTKQIPWLLVRKRTIPTERPPRPANLVPTFSGGGIAWSSQRIPTAVNLCFRDRSRYFFFQIAPQVILTRSSGPCSTPTVSQLRESNPGPLDL